MDGSQYSKIVSFIWGIADDVLRDLYVRGKYRDVILPMTVLRRLDAVLEPTKQQVLETKVRLDSARITNQDGPLRQAAGQAFYNTSKFTLRDLRSRASQQKLRADFEAYLDGFSPNVQEILDNFEFRNQVPRLSKADALGALIEKFLDSRINLSPHPVGSGASERPSLDNHGMGTVFEELVRRFNEENNEEAGEHWTPRDVVQLMARLIFLPIADQIESGTYLLYDGALGTGGMLTVAEGTLKALAEERGKQVVTHLYGQEINAETYAICKADLLLKGEGEEADNVVGGPEYSTLSNDAFPAREFDFMLSNPPYGKSWKSDLERMGGKSGIKDPRFIIEHAGDPDFSLVTRSSDGQMMFLANLLSKMKHGTKLGSRVAEIHNGSSLFTGDAGQGESNIRRWIIENDWLEAIVALPPNMFYNTPIATFVWVVGNRKRPERRGKVQLINATGWFKPLRKRLGMKSAVLGEDDIESIVSKFLEFKEGPHSKILPNAAFGYWKVEVTRPLRLRGIDAERTYSSRELKSFREAHEAVADGVPVIRRVQKDAGLQADPSHGLFERTLAGKRVIVEYEPDPEFRKTELIPLQEPGGLEGFMEREIHPYHPGAWIDSRKQVLGYEINWYRFFAKPKESRPLEETRVEILKSERATRDLLQEIYSTMARGSQATRRRKPSGQSWLPEVPENWELVPLHTLLRQRKENVRTQSDDFTLLSLSLGGVIPRDMENPQGKFPADFSTYQVVEPGDLVFCLFDMDETPRTVGIGRQRGMVTGAYTVFECDDKQTAEYLYLFFLAMDQHKRLRPLYTGLRKVIPKEVFLRIKVPIPPRDELEAILKLATAETSNLDKAIARTQEEIALLREYRARMILDVVSGDIDAEGLAAELPDVASDPQTDADVGAGPDGAEATLIDGAKSE